jgi:hypothetical protein
VGSTQATTSIYTDVYIHIYTLFSTLFRTKFTTISTASSTTVTTTLDRSTHHHQKKIFSTKIHKISQDFTRFHHQKTPKNTKIPKIAKNPKKPSFWGTPPTPPKTPIFPGFRDPPNCTNLHKFAQICTNLHPQNTTFGGYPICRDPLDRPC